MKKELKYLVNRQIQYKTTLNKTMKISWQLNNTTTNLL